MPGPVLGAGPSGSWPVTNPVLKSLLVQFRRHRDTYQNGPKALPKGHHRGRACPEKVKEAFLEEMLSPQKFSKDKGWLDWQGPNRE